MAIVVAPRLVAQLTPLATDGSPPPPPLGPAVWEDTQVVLPGEASLSLRNVFTGQMSCTEGERLPVASVLSDFPVALLTNLLPS